MEKWKKLRNLTWRKVGAIEVRKSSTCDVCTCAMNGTLAYRRLSFGALWQVASSMLKLCKRQTDKYLRRTVFSSRTHCAHVVAKNFRKTSQQNGLVWAAMQWRESWTTVQRRISNFHWCHTEFCSFQIPLPKLALNLKIRGDVHAQRAMSFSVVVRDEVIPQKVDLQPAQMLQHSLRIPPEFGTQDDAASF